MDAADVYTTDAEVRQYDLQLLEDDLHYFPSYDAVLLYRADLEKRAPEVVKALLGLQGTISEDAMREMNARVQTGSRFRRRKSPPTFLTKIWVITSRFHVKPVAERILARTLEHLLLVVVSLFWECWRRSRWALLAAQRPLAGARDPRGGRRRADDPRPGAAGAAGGGLQAWAPYRPLSLCFVTVCCRSCATPIPACTTSPRRVRESADALGLSSFSPALFD